MDVDFLQTRLIRDEFLVNDTYDEYKIVNEPCDGEIREPRNIKRELKDF